MGALASPRGEALFSILSRSEFDLAGVVSTRDIVKLAPNQPAQVKVIGAGDVEGSVRRVATTIDPAWKAPRPRLPNEVRGDV